VSFVAASFQLAGGDAEHLQRRSRGGCNKCTVLVALLRLGSFNRRVLAPAVAHAAWSEVNQGQNAGMVDVPANRVNSLPHRQHSSQPTRLLAHLAVLYNRPPCPPRLQQQDKSCLGLAHSPT